MEFLGRWPDGFTPEEHGWIKAPQSSADLKVWLRLEVPFAYPASIAQCLFDEATGAVGGWYTGPVKGEFPEVVRAGDVWAEMLRTDLNHLNAAPAQG